MMRKGILATDPDSYVTALSGWQRACVEELRAEEHRVLFGFWRGLRLRAIEERLKPGGKYEMATLELREGASITPTVARRLVKEAIALNKSLGDPTQSAKPGNASKGRHAKRARP